MSNENLSFDKSSEVFFPLSYSLSYPHLSPRCLYEAPYTSVIVLEGYSRSELQEEIVTEFPSVY